MSVKRLTGAALVLATILFSACGDGAQPDPCTETTMWSYPPMTFVQQVPDGTEVEVEGHKAVCEGGEAR